MGTSYDKTMSGWVGSVTRTSRLDCGSDPAHQWDIKCELFSLAEVCALPSAVLRYSVLPSVAVWIVFHLFVCRATHPTVLGWLHPELLNMINMTPILNVDVYCVGWGMRRLQVRDVITSLHHLQCSIPVPMFSSAVRCFELQAGGMFLLHAHNPGYYYFCLLIMNQRN